MRFTPFLLLLFFVFAASTDAISQDSSVVKWRTSISRDNAQQVTITFHGMLRHGWHFYAAADVEDGLSGFKVDYADSSVRQEPVTITGNRQIINDPIFEGRPKVVLRDSFTITQKVSGVDPALTQLRPVLIYEVADAGNFIPEEQKISIPLKGEAVTGQARRILIPSIDIKAPLTNCGESISSDTQSHGLAGLFFLGFLGGLVALLTPCVFPMIPLTVSFFTKKATSKSSGIRNALLYGFFIFGIYVLLSLPFHFLDSVNPEILNNISTNVYLNVFFFAIFIFFAFSFFGYYEITLPSRFSNTADSKSGAGNVAGIFFMALTLALVSFSCTGPILGSLLAGSLSNDGGAMQLTSGMAGFGFALALPFALFALFPNWLNSLPKSGGWLTTVKIVLGFLELGLALKFLSNADLVMHWGILKREIFIGIWIIISALLTLYLFGKLRFKDDSSPKKLHPVRLSLAVLSLLFTLYLVPGVTNTKWANLQLISGFPPPLYYSIYHKSSDCILNLNCTRDYEKGLRRARAENKPILLDFTGYACVNCRRMEEKVWVDPAVYELMQNNFIVVSLYVDDKEKLPPAERFIYKTKEGVEKEINTVGALWATFETENFANNAQPLYAILNTEEQLLANPVGYMPSAKEYEAWLRCGLDAFKK